jgi:hypothetical protein
MSQPDRLSAVAVDKVCAELLSGGRQHPKLLCAGRNAFALFVREGAWTIYDFGGKAPSFTDSRVNW